MSWMPIATNVSSLIWADAMTQDLRRRYEMVGLSKKIGWLLPTPRINQSQVYHDSLGPSHATR